MTLHTATYARLEITGGLKEVPEIHTLDNGTQIANICLAVDERRKTEDGKLETYAEWHKITLFGEAAEIIHNQGKAGMQIKLSAKVKTKQTEIKVAAGSSRMVYVPTFTANSIEIVSGTPSADSENSNQEDLIDVKEHS